MTASLHIKTRVNWNYSVQHTIKIDQKVDAEILWITAAYIKPEYRSIGMDHQ